VSEDAARRLAATLGRRGLAAPGRLLLDAHRPLAPLLADLSAAFGPMLAPIGGRAAADVVELLDDPGALDRLVEELEPPSRRAQRADPR
jgi:hypothetical protein